MSGILTKISTEEVLSAIQGAAGDPDRIGSEYLPEIIPVDGVTLSDSSAVELPAGTLGLNGDGRLVIHDGDTTGGVDAEGMILRGAVTHTVSDSIAAAQIIEIAQAVIPASYFSDGDAVFALGNVVIQSALSNYNPATNPALVLYFRDSAGARNATAEPDDGYRIILATAATLAAYTIVEIMEKFSMALASNLLSINVESVVGSSRRRTLAAGVATETETNFANGGTAGERNITYGGAGGFAYLCIGVFLPADAATADASGSFSAACDIKFIKP